MENIEFSRWCLKATWRIGFPPDRKRVRQEYLNHMTDHYDALIESGVDRLEARRLVLESMGDPDEVAPLLAAIHRPFWGYFLRVSRIVAIVLLCISLLPIYRYAKDLQFEETANMRDFDIYSESSYGGDTGRTLHHLSQPNLSFCSDGSRFVITDAALITFPVPNDKGELTALYIRMDQTGWLPAEQRDEYFDFFNIPGWFSARDSLGNVYPSYMEQNDYDVNAVIPASVQSGIFTYTHELWINYFPTDAQWVELCYERDGRSFTLRIDLTGGVTA